MRQIQIEITRNGLMVGGKSQLLGLVVCLFGGYFMQPAGAYTDGFGQELDWRYHYGFTGLELNRDILESLPSTLHLYLLIIQ